MAIRFCIGPTFSTVKYMVQNRTTSNLADDDHEWIGLHGTSIEGANLAVINKRKPLESWETETYKILRLTNSQILDQVWPELPALITI